MIFKEIDNIENVGVICHYLGKANVLLKELEQFIQKCTLQVSINNMNA